MDIRLQAEAAAHHGVFTRSAALASGYSSALIQSNLDRGIWQRLRIGVYVESERWERLSRDERHLLQAHAAALRFDEDAVFTLVTGAIIHRLFHWGVPLDDLTVIRAAGKGNRIEAGVKHCNATLPPEQVAVVAGLRVCCKERLMVDVSRAYGFEQAVVICDAALRAGAKREIAHQIYLDTCYSWPFSHGAADPIVFADDRAESPGESRLRVRFQLLGLPEPEPQGVIYDERGRFVARCDLLFREQRTAVEFDGKAKYGIEGKDPVAQVYAEKRREDGIRETGHEVVRIVTPDLDDMTGIERRVLRAFARARRAR